MLFDLVCLCGTCFADVLLVKWYFDWILFWAFAFCEFVWVWVLLSGNLLGFLLFGLVILTLVVLFKCACC